MSTIDSNSERNTNNKKRPASPLAFLLTTTLLFVGSFTFGIILLSILLVLLTWGTLVESEHGAAVAQFVLYANSWFYGLVALLALNIFVSMLLRFPWKRYDIPFLTAHVGILLLLFGCYQTWKYGEEAKITLPEGSIGRVAVKQDKPQFEIRRVPHSAADSTEPLHIPFQPGPFSWQDYNYANWIKDGRRYKWSLWQALKFTHRDKGVLATGDPNVKLEVLDYVISPHGEERVQLRVTCDGKEETFWLRASAPTSIPVPPEQDQMRYIVGKEMYSVKLNYENIDLGFGILLKKFDQHTEPGTQMPAHFSSLVDYVEPIDQAEVGKTFSQNWKGYRALPGGENVLISMNRPGFFGGAAGHGFRIYQSSYRGPFYPDDPQFHELYDCTIFPGEDRPRESISATILSVNADPGRGWKYFGSLLIVLGVAMFVWRKHQ